MITVRDSSERVAGGFTLMTGTNTASVVAINPTVEQLKVLYDKDDVREPVYVGTDNNGNPNVRLDIYVKPTGTESVQKFALFLSDAEAVTKEGNKKWYRNAHGQIGCFPIPPEGQPVVIPESQANFISPEGMVATYQGERQLVEFIQEWCGLHTGKTGDDVSLDFTKLFGGDYSELNYLKEQCDKKENTVGLMFGVRLVDGDDGTTKRYQDIYTKAFCRPSKDIHAFFTEKLNNPYGTWDRDYQRSTEWKEYSPTAVNVTEGATAAGGIDSITGEDDLPW